MKKVVFYTSLLVIACSSIFYLSSFTNTESTKDTASAPLILVEIYEIPKYSGKGVIIHRGGGKIEHVPFKDFTSDNHDDNGEITLNTIAKLEGEGYVMEGITSGLTESGMITKIFMRRK
ncbi:MAG: hypothetical protein K2Q22_13395 [Cytophagales bacterium]|nr:hypothetical protein [Cytophagales bacterium]